MHNKSANGYAIKSANRLILGTARGVMGAGLARRHHQRYLGTVTRSHPQQFQRTHLNSPQSPGSSWASCLCTTRLAAGILQHTKSCWTLVVIAGGATKRYRKDAGAGGKYARPLRHHQSSGEIAENILAGFHRCKRFVEVWKTPGELCEVVL